MPTMLVEGSPCVPRHSVRTFPDGTMDCYVCGYPKTHWTACGAKFHTLGDLLAHAVSKHKWEPRGARPQHEVDLL